MEEIVKNEFEFYSKLAKPLVLNLPNSKDRMLAAAWIQKFRDEESGEEKLRTTYLKLLLFCLQRRKLTGIFADDPSDYTMLEVLPPDIDLNEFARNLLEQEKAERIEKIRLEMIGDMDAFPVFTTDCSPDLTEYVAAQDIPNFGVHAYYAISKQPVNKWQRAEKAILPKGTKSAIDTTITTAAAAAAASSCVCSPKGTASAPEVEEPTEDGEEPECRKKKKDKGPEKKKRRPKKLGTSPPSHPIGEVRQITEERSTPTWGTNLIEIKERTDIGNIEEPTDAEKALEEEVAKLMEEEEAAAEDEDQGPKERDTIASKADEMLHVLDEYKQGQMSKPKKLPSRLAKLGDRSGIKAPKSTKAPKIAVKGMKKGKGKGGVGPKPANLPAEFADWTEKDLKEAGLTWADLMPIDENIDDELQRIEDDFMGGVGEDEDISIEKSQTDDYSLLDMDALLREAEEELAAAKTIYDEGVDEDEPIVELFDDEFQDIQEELNVSRAAEEVRDSSPAISSGIPVTTPKRSASPKRFKSPEKVFAEEDDDLLQHRISPLRPPKKKKRDVLKIPKRPKKPSMPTDKDPNISKVFKEAKKLVREDSFLAHEREFEEDYEFEQLERQFEQEEGAGTSGRPPCPTRFSGFPAFTPGDEQRARQRAQEQEQLLRTPERPQQQEQRFRTPDPNLERVAQHFASDSAGLEGSPPFSLYPSPPPLTEEEEFEMYERMYQQESPGLGVPQSRIDRATYGINLSFSDYPAADADGSFGLIPKSVMETPPRQLLEGPIYLERQKEMVMEAARQQEAFLRQGSPEANQIIDEAGQSLLEELLNEIGSGQNQLMDESVPSYRSPEQLSRVEDLEEEESDDLGIIKELADYRYTSPTQEERLRRFDEEMMDIFDRCGGFGEQGVCPSQTPQQAVRMSPQQEVAVVRTPIMDMPPEPSDDAALHAPAEGPCPASRSPSPQRRTSQPPTPPPMPFFPGISAPLTPVYQRPIHRPAGYMSPPPPPMFGPQNRPEQYSDDFYSPAYFDYSGLDDIDMPNFGELPFETPEPCTPCGVTQMVTPQRVESGRRAARLRPSPPPMGTTSPSGYEDQSPFRHPRPMMPRKLFDGPCPVEKTPEPHRGRRRRPRRRRDARPRSPAHDFEKMEQQFQREQIKGPCGRAPPQMSFSPGDAERVRQRAQQQEDLLRSPSTPAVDDEFEQMERQFQMEEGEAPCDCRQRTPQGAPSFIPEEAESLHERVRQQEALLMQSSARTPRGPRLVPEQAQRRPVRAPRVGTPTGHIGKPSRRLFEGVFEEDDERRKVIDVPIPAPCVRTPPQAQPPSPVWSTPEDVSGPSRRPTGLTPPVYDSDFSPPPSPPKSPKFAPAKKIKKRGIYPGPPATPRTPVDQRQMPSPCRAAVQRVPFEGGQGTPAQRGLPLVPRRMFKEPGKTPILPSAESPIVYSPFTSPCPGDVPDVDFGPLLDDETPPVEMSPPVRILREGQMYYPDERLPCGTPENLPTMAELKKHRFDPDRPHMHISHQKTFGRGPGPMPHRESVRGFGPMERIHEYGSDDEWRRQLVFDADLETYSKYYNKPVGMFPDKKKPKHFTYPPRQFASPIARPKSPPLNICGYEKAFQESLKANLQVSPELYPPPQHPVCPAGRREATGTAGGLGTFETQRERDLAFLAAANKKRLPEYLCHRGMEDIADQADLMFDYEGMLFDITPPEDDLNMNYYPDIVETSRNLITSVEHYDLPEGPPIPPCMASPRTPPSIPSGSPRTPPPRPITAPPRPTTAPPQPITAPAPCAAAKKRIPAKKQLRETRSSQLRKEQLAKQQKAEKEAQLKKERAAKAAADKKKRIQAEIRAEIKSKQRVKLKEKVAESREAYKIPGPEFMEELARHEIDYPGYDERVMVKSRFRRVPRRSRHAFRQMDELEEEKYPCQPCGSEGYNYQEALSKLGLGRPSRGFMEPMEEEEEDDDIAPLLDEHSRSPELGRRQIIEHAVVHRDPDLDDLAEFEALERQMEMEQAGQVGLRTGPAQVEQERRSPCRGERITYSPPRPQATFGPVPYNQPAQHLPMSPSSPCPPTPPSPPPMPPEAENIFLVEPPFFEDMLEEDRLPYSPPPRIPHPPSPPLTPERVREQISAMARPAFDPALRVDVIPRRQRRAVKSPCGVCNIQEEAPLIPHLGREETTREERRERRRRREAEPQKRKKTKKPQADDDISRYVRHLEQKFNLSPVKSPEQEYDVLDESIPEDLQSPMRPYRPPIYSPCSPLSLREIPRPPYQQPVAPQSIFPFSPPTHGELYVPPADLPIHSDLVELAGYQPPLEVSEGICPIAEEQALESLIYTPPHYPETDEMELDREAMLRYQPPNVLKNLWLAEPEDLGLLTPPSVGRGPCRTYTPTATPPFNLLDSPMITDRFNEAFLMTPPGVEGPYQGNLQEFLIPTPPLEKETSIKEMRYHTLLAKGRRGIKPQPQYFGGYGETPRRPIPRWYGRGGRRNVIQEVEEPISPPTPGTPVPQLPEPSSVWTPTLDEFEQLEREAEEATRRRDRRRPPGETEFNELRRKGLLAEMEEESERLMILSPCQREFEQMEQQIMEETQGRKISKRRKQQMDFEDIQRRSRLEELTVEAERLDMEFAKPPSPTVGRVPSPRMPSPSRTPPVPQFVSTLLDEAAGPCGPCGPFVEGRPFDPLDYIGEMDYLDQIENMVAGYQSPEPLSESWEGLDQIENMVAGYQSPEPLSESWQGLDQIENMVAGYQSPEPLSESWQGLDQIENMVAGYQSPEPLSESWQGLDQIENMVAGYQSPEPLSESWQGLDQIENMVAGYQSPEPLSESWQGLDQIENMVAGYQSPEPLSESCQGLDQIENMVAGYQSPEPLSESWQGLVSQYEHGSPLELDQEGVEQRMMEEMLREPYVDPYEGQEPPEMLDQMTDDVLQGYLSPPPLFPTSSLPSTPPTPPSPPPFNPAILALERMERKFARKEAEDARREEYFRREQQELREMFGPSSSPPSPGPGADFYAEVYGHHVPEDFRQGERPPCIVKDQIGRKDMMIRLSRQSRPPDLDVVTEQRVRIRSPEQPRPRRPRSAPTRAAGGQPPQAAAQPGPSSQVTPASSAQKVAEARKQYLQSTRLRPLAKCQRTCVGAQPPQLNLQSVEEFLRAGEQQEAATPCPASLPRMSVEEAQRRARERTRSRRRQEQAGPPARAVREPPLPPPPQPFTGFLPRQVQVRTPRPTAEMQTVDQVVRGGPRVEAGPSRTGRQGAGGCGGSGQPCGGRRSGSSSRQPETRRGGPARRPAGAGQAQAPEGGARRRVTKTSSIKNIVTKQN